MQIKGNGNIHVWMQKEIGRIQEITSLIENIPKCFLRFLEWNHICSFRITVIRSI